MRLPLLLAVLLVPASAQANLIYTYTGETFVYTTGVYGPRDIIDGSFVLRDDFTKPVPGVDSPILWDITSGVLGYSFSDGHQQFTPENSTAHFHIGVTDPLTIPGSTAQVLGWWTISIVGTTGGLSAMFINHEFSAGAWLGDVNAPTSLMSGSTETPNGTGPGVWTVTESTPEPAALGLIALGAVVLWRRRHG